MKRDRRDDVERAWSGSEAGITGGNGLIIAALVLAVVWRLSR